MKKLLFVFLPAAAVLCWLRVQLKLHAVDAATGFYTAMPTQVKVFGVVLCAALVLLAVLGYRGDYTALERFHQSRKLSFLPLILLALALGVKSAVALIDILQRGARLQTFSTAVEALGILSALCLIKIALDYFTGIKERVSFFICVVPMIFSLLTLVKRFYLYNSINSISDQMLEVLFYASLTALLLEQIRVISQMGVAKGLKSVAPAGMLCALVGLVLFAGQFAARIGGTATLMELPLTELIFVLMVSVYALILALSAAGAQGRKQGF